MKDTHIIGLTAIVSSGLATILLVSLLVPMLGGVITPQEETVTLTVYSYDHGHVDETLGQNDRWVVQFSSAEYVHSWLLTDSNYQYYLSYGSINGYLSSSYAYDGNHDYTATSGGIYYVVFEVSNTAQVSVTTLVYRYP